MWLACAESLLHMHYLTTVYWGKDSLRRPAPLSTGHIITNEYVRSKSGNSIGVWTVHNGPDAKRIVLFIHGQLGSRDQSHRRAAMEFFACHFNAHVVTYDPSGYADSGGWPTAQALHLDGQSILDWTVAKFSCLPVYVWGHSLGGPVTMSAVTTGQSVRGVVLEATFGRLSEALTMGIYGTPVRWLGAERLEQLVQTIFANHYDTEHFIRQSEISAPPIFILHGSADWTVRASAVPQLIQACKDAQRPHQSLIVQGGGHNDLHTGRWTHIVGPQILAWMLSLEPVT